MGDTNILTFDEAKDYESLLLKYEGITHIWEYFSYDGHDDTDRARPLLDSVELSFIVKKFSEYFYYVYDYDPCSRKKYFELVRKEHLYNTNEVKKVIDKNKYMKLIFVKS